ncbi:hypothetical protein KSF_099700 [Reticulibacter mediterranei]|uniref:DUF2252 domain-containing protein n=2 Tax=Reticulibacter mediterranei TaxID=2778369 RepID=A0A8J3N634_9CHLR|nr:hypothetical protein KSF_099700 [Reticulibacter mediterranei]
MEELFERIRKDDRGKKKSLLCLKYEEMSQDIFTFFRGTCPRFYREWYLPPPQEAPAVWICGDAHLENFGAYKSASRLVYFGVNDFDEAALAPCTLDLGRFLTGLLVSASSLSISQEDAQALCCTFLESYTECLLAGRVQTLDRATTSGVVQTLLERVEQRTRKHMLEKHVLLTPGHVRLKPHKGKEAVEHVSAQEKEAVEGCVKQWSKHQPHPPFFRVLDLAHRVVGTGSLGIPRYVLLIEGKGAPDGYYLLDVKEARRSSVPSRLRCGSPNWATQAERMVQVRTWSQDAPPALLAELQGKKKSYVLRELQPQEEKVNRKDVLGNRQAIEGLVQAMGQALAFAHLRSGGQKGAALSGELKRFAQQASVWQASLLAAAQPCVEQVRTAYDAFQEQYAAHKRG